MTYEALVSVVYPRTFIRDARARNLRACRVPGDPRLVQILASNRAEIERLLMIDLAMTADEAASMIREIKG